MDKRKGHRGVKIGDGRADSCPRRRRRDGGNKEVESLTDGKSAGSQD